MKGKQTQASLQKYRFYVYIIFESIDETSSDGKKVSSSFLSPSQAKPSWDQCLCWLPAFDGDFVMICWWKNPLKLNEDWTSECDSEWNEEKKFLDHAERRVSMGTSKIPYNFCCSSGKIIKMFFYLLRLFFACLFTCFVAHSFSLWAPTIKSSLLTRYTKRASTCKQNVIKCFSFKLSNILFHFPVHFMILAFMFLVFYRQ